MKSNLVLQFNGRDRDEASMIKEAQQAWTKAGNKAADIKKLELYAQPENSVVYYVINDDFKGSFEI